jgi:hypothetical protein
MSEQTMRDSEPRSRVRIARAGAIARECLGIDGKTEIIAVFERSFYVACPHGIVCVGRDIGAGPIHVEVAPAPDAASGAGRQFSGRDGAEIDWVELGIATGTRGLIIDGVPEIAPRLWLDLGSASEWIAPEMPRFVPECARAGVELLKARAHDRAPLDGLARLALFADATGRTARAAEGSIGVVRDRLPRAIRGGEPDGELLRAITLLLGLGPGLTPSGDDLLGGLMLALTAGGHAHLRDAFWRALEPELDALTVPISAMHLSAAADGMGCEAMHRMLDAVMLAEPHALEQSIDEVAAIGHTSGWDGIAGSMLGFEALIAS